jgi:hypothetical protein
MPFYQFRSDQIIKKNEQRGYAGKMNRKKKKSRQGRNYDESTLPGS